MATLYIALLSDILFLPFKLTNPGYHAVSLGHSSGSSLKVKGQGTDLLALCCNRPNLHKEHMFCLTVECILYVYALLVQMCICVCVGLRKHKMQYSI